MRTIAEEMLSRINAEIKLLNYVHLTFEKGPG